MADCKHPELLSRVDINPIQGTHYRRVALHISCPACGREFRFHGESVLKDGGLTLLIPIEEGPKRVTVGGIALPAGIGRG